MKDVLAVMSLWLCRVDWRTWSLCWFRCMSSSLFLAPIAELASRLSVAAPHAKLVYSRLAVRSWLGRVLCVYPEQTKCCRGTLGQRV